MSGQTIDECMLMFDAGRLALAAIACSVMTAYCMLLMFDAGRFALVSRFLDG
jgi:hypothetical protein